MTRRRRTVRPERAPARLLLACALLAALPACSGTTAGRADVVAGETDVAPVVVPATAAATEVSLGRVHGLLDTEARERLVDAVLPAVDTWIDGGFGGDYPRRDFSGAFASFTPGAAERAAESPRLMSNAAVGATVDGVELLRREVVLDVLAVDGTAVGVTARVDLLLALSGQTERRDRVQGALQLTYERGWQVFGFDMTRGAA